MKARFHLFFGGWKYLIPYMEAVLAYIFKLLAAYAKRDSKCIHSSRVSLHWNQHWNRIFFFQDFDWFFSVEYQGMPSYTHLRFSFPHILSLHMKQMNSSTDTKYQIESFKNLLNVYNECPFSTHTHAQQSKTKACVPTVTAQNIVEIWYLIELYPTSSG